jgi:hypothetical protein
VRGRAGPAARTLLLGAVGVAGFEAAGLPLPFLLGPLFACLVAAVMGVRLAATGRIGTAMRTVLGVAVGAAVTPELVARLPSMAWSVALVPVLVAAAGALGYPFFRRVCGFDHPTAWYAAMPGGLQDMLAFGEEAGADMRALSLVHATRVLLIVSAAPVLLTAVWDRPLDAAPGAPAAAIPAGALLLMAAAAALGWWAAARAGLFGAAILGPMIAAAALSLTGVLDHRPPAEAILAAQFFIGIAVGAHYTGVTGAEIRRDVAAGAGLCLILFAVSFLLAEAVALAGLAPTVEAFLAFAPGGQAEMAVLAIVAGADLAFVVAHHLVRLVVVIAGAPVAAAMLARPRGGDG